MAGWWIRQEKKAEMAGWWIRQEKRWQYEEVLRVWGTRGVIPLFKLNSVILEKATWEKGSPGAPCYVWSHFYYPLLLVN
jgi:hypothetical protein